MAGLALVLAELFVATALAEPTAPTLLAEITEVLLCGVFGCGYGYVMSHGSRRTETSPYLQPAIGAGFAMMIWAVGLRFLAPGVDQLIVHTLGYGVPLGVVYARSARRSRRARLVLLPPIRNAA